MTLEALVFDLDGTFVDTDELHRRAFNQAFLEFELGFDWSPDVYEKLLTVSGGADRIRHFIDRSSLSQEQKLALHAIVTAVHREKTRIYGELLESNAGKLRSGVRRLMTEARQADLKIGVVATSASANMQPLILAVLGREGASDIRAFVSSDRVARKKPAPDIYLLAASMLGVPPDRCVAFEDSTNGVLAAKAAGIFTIATPSRWTRSQDFSRADICLSELGEPDAPLGPADSIRLGGATCVGLEQVRALYARRDPDAAVQRQR
ncbi:MAG: HAD-IA family hydrolase [Pseudorhodoplanes sp.]